MGRKTYFLGAGDRTRFASSPGHRANDSIMDGCQQAYCLPDTAGDRTRFASSPGKPHGWFNIMDGCQQAYCLQDTAGDRTRFAFSPGHRANDPIIDGCQQAYCLPSSIHGLYPGLKKCPPDTFLPCLTARPPSSSPPPQ